MSTPILPPNPSLVAISLNVRTRAGPSFVFHYPAIPSTDGALPSSFAKDSKAAAADHSSRSDAPTSGSSDEGEWSSDDTDSIYYGNKDIQRNGHQSRFSRNTGTRSGMNGTDGGGSRDAFSLRSHFGRISSSRTRSRGLGRGPNRFNDGDYNDDDDDDDIRHRGSGSEDESHKGGGAGGAGGGVNGGRGGMRSGRRRHVMGEGSNMEWEYLLGFPTSSLEKLLSPQRTFHKKRLEIGLEELVFLGYPIFAKEGGGWKKRRRKKKKQRKNGHNLSGSLAGDGQKKNATTVENGSGSNDLERSGEGGDEKICATDDANQHSDDCSEARSNSTTDGDEEMTMFTVVFILDPPLLEYKVRVMDIYDNVVKKFAKALKYEQAQSNYVWHESRKILEMKEKAKENGTPIHSLWPNIINSSPLAKSIAVIYDSISLSKIAHVNLGEVDTSLQIPQPISISFLPTPLEPQVPGLWLTTATLIDEDSDISISPHAALLLLEDADTLIKEVEGDAKELSAPLAYYIRHSNPTKSLKKISAASSIALEDIQILARHLIYWRRARAIPPLHPRDIYLVSPNADMRNLRKSMSEYSARFPTLLSMPEMLHKLSAAPRSYITLIPSKDHKAAYMEILAFLMRGGWVTQLRTFAWIRVMPDVKAAVAAQSGEIDESNRESHSDNALSRPSRPTTPSSKTALKMSAGTGTQSPRSGSHSAKSAGESPKTASANNSQPAENSQPSSERNKSPLNTSKASLEEVETSTTTPAAPPPTSTALEPNLLAPTLILAPHKANNLESRWMDYIRSTIADPELRELWPLWVRYFDGQHALDEIAAREGLKRKKVAALLGQLREMGVLLTVRHW